MTDRKALDEKYKSYLDAAMKYDQFLAGALLASSAYLTQTIKFVPMGLDPATAQLVSLLMVATSTVCAFQRMDHTVKVMRFEILAKRYEGAEAAEAMDWAKQYSRSTNRYAKARNVLMLLGGALFIGSKIWAGYA
ncbi:hypothetical protein HX878_17310 [Pseudomonas veronii]|uniref:hypothetical protein n=1 Tax=Pseudomonas veronii TaxID=76761 RepID=UPI0015A10F7A|nr:hypothetical protein [Pseudomonas veronii]NWD56506.1 hypothetical protein [Pseudomonas veronii]